MSLTQKGNIGQMVSFFLVLTGMSKEDAEAGAGAVFIVIGIIAHMLTWATTWYGRYRHGDIDILGFKK
jgi:hypothetical protein